MKINPEPFAYIKYPLFDVEGCIECGNEIVLTMRVGTVSRTHANPKPKIGIVIDIMCENDECSRSKIENCIYRTCAVEGIFRNDIITFLSKASNIKVVRSNIRLLKAEWECMNHRDKEKDNENE